MRLFEARHPEGEEHKALGKGVKDVQEWLEMSNEESEGGGEVRYLSVPEPLSMAQATSVRAQMAMRVFKEGKLRAKRDWQHAMKAKGEAGMRVNDDCLVNGNVVGFVRRATRRVEEERGVSDARAFALVHVISKEGILCILCARVYYYYSFEKQSE
jgi:hypothetical protein